MELRKGKRHNVSTTTLLKSDGRASGFWSSTAHCSYGTRCWHCSATSRPMWEAFMLEDILNDMQNDHAARVVTRTRHAPLEAPSLSHCQALPERLLDAVELVLDRLPLPRVIGHFKLGKEFVRVPPLQQLGIQRLGSLVTATAIAALLGTRCPHCRLQDVLLGAAGRPGDVIHANLAVQSLVVEERPGGLVGLPGRPVHGKHRPRARKNPA
eukprot:scaffold47657_cov36-Prasinocladus_malaysianus.AAC.1